MRQRAAGFTSCLAFAVCLAALVRPARAEEIPAIVALTLDTSGSIRPELLNQVKDLAIGLLQSLPAGSQVALLTFDDQSRVIQERTADIETVRAALLGVNRAGNYTALYDALYDASRYLRDAPLARKAIVLVTDGLDENSSVEIEDGLRIAVDGKIPVLCVGVGRIQEAVLRRIAKLTSGDYTPMGQADPAQLAERIRLLPPPSPPPVAPQPAPPPSLPAQAQEAGPLTWIVVVVGALIVASAFGAAFMLRRRLAPAAPEAEPDKGAPADDSGPDGTIVSRSGDVGEVERTMLLRVRPRLVIVRGPGVGQSFNLSPETSLSIGRSPNNDIPIEDGAVSGEHCRVRPEGGAFVIHDLSSTNGTFVNDRRIKRHRLAEGDTVRVGETLLQFKQSP